MLDTDLRGPALLTIDEVVTALRLGRSHLYRLIRRGEIRQVHVGRAARVPRSEVERFLRRLETEQWEETSDRAS
jgi:excisionase family DNA binding protein